METLNEQFGTAAEFEEPKGGIFLWVKLPDHVDTMKLYQPALKAGVAINPGPQWSTERELFANAGCGCASRARRTRKSARVSPCWPRSVPANSACRRAAPISKGPVDV